MTTKRGPKVEFVGKGRVGRLKRIFKNCEASDIDVGPGNKTQDRTQLTDVVKGVHRRNSKRNGKGW